MNEGKEAKTIKERQKGGRGTKKGQRKGRGRKKRGQGITRFHRGSR